MRGLDGGHGQTNIPAVRWAARAWHGLKRHGTQSGRERAYGVCCAAARRSSRSPVALGTEQIPKNAPSRVFALPRVSAFPSSSALSPSHGGEEHSEELSHMTRSELAPSDDCVQPLTARTAAS